MKYFRLLPFILKKLLRSQIRFFVTVFGCAIASFIVCFFLSADYSVGKILIQAESANQIIVSQLDKY